MLPCRVQPTQRRDRAAEAGLRDTSMPFSVLNRGPGPDPSRPSAGSSRAANWVATIILALLLPALILPSGDVRADGPQVSLPETAVAGGLITAVGTGFPARARLSLAWDGMVAVKQVRVGANGRFSRSFDVPASAE